MFEILIYEALWMIFIFSLVPLFCVSFFGLIVGVLQSATQIQEQSIGFFVKFISFFVILFILSPIAIRQLVVFIQNILGSFSTFGKI